MYCLQLLQCNTTIIKKHLVTLNIEIFANPKSPAEKLINDTPTMMKSNQHHALLKYATNPIEKSLRQVSIRNTTVSILSR